VSLVWKDIFVCYIPAVSGVGKALQYWEKKNSGNEKKVASLQPASMEDTQLANSEKKKPLFFPPFSGKEEKRASQKRANMQPLL